jgi:hypothetical protein
LMTLSQYQYITSSISFEELSRDRWRQCRSSPLQYLPVRYCRFVSRLCQQ